MTALIDAIQAEFARYKALADGAIRQVADADLSTEGQNGGNSIAVICWHVSGNLRSRFTDFLTADGEKPWRRREEEFEARTVSRDQLRETWEQGWETLFGALAGVTDEHLGGTITIRGQVLSVSEALLRSLAHAAYHVGQIVYVAKSLQGGNWEYLSIPPGGSDAYNRNPKGERASGHAAALRGGSIGRGR
jgi:hypothetical protein